jgi:hypothetical protein
MKHEFIREDGIVYWATIQEHEAIYNRKQTYDIATQLELLADDIQFGLFGEEAKTGKFYQYIQSVKARFPKNE